jgi:hypothetical protein
MVEKSEASGDYDSKYDNNHSNRNNTLVSREKEYATALSQSCLSQPPLAQPSLQAAITTATSEGASETAYDELQRELFKTVQALQDTKAENDRVKQRLVAVSVSCRELEDVNSSLSSKLRAFDETVSSEDVAEMRESVERLQQELDRRTRVESEIRELLITSERRYDEMESKWMKEQESFKSSLTKLKKWNDTVTENVTELQQRCEGYKNDNETLRRERDLLRERLEEERISNVYNESSAGNEMRSSPARSSPARSSPPRSPSPGPRSVSPPRPTPPVTTATTTTPASPPLQVDTVPTPPLSAAAADDDDDSESDSDDDVKSIEWIASTVSSSSPALLSSAARKANHPSSQVMKLITERPRTQIESPKPKRQVIQAASPKKKSSPARSKLAASSSKPSSSASLARRADLPPASPPIPPRPKRKEGAKEVIEKISASTTPVSSPPRSNNNNDDNNNNSSFSEEKPVPTPLPFVMAVKQKNEVEEYGHLVVTSELQAKYRREQTPERKKKVKKKVAGMSGTKKSLK